MLLLLGLTSMWSEFANSIRCNLPCPALRSEYVSVQEAFRIEQKMLSGSTARAASACIAWRWVSLLCIITAHVVNQTTALGAILRAAIVLARSVEWRHSPYHCCLILSIKKNFAQYPSYPSHKYFRKAS